jgi:ribosomal protein L37E
MTKSNTITQKTCPRCGLSVNDDVILCPQCGFGYPFEIRCYNCMRKFHTGLDILVKDGVKYCPFCNIPLEGQNKKKMMTRNIKPIIIGVSIALIVCLLYVFLVWGGF